jgi:diadenosine tetraphosphate (Ap4A) HIT family hydrolase
MISYENLDDARAAGVAPWNQSVPELSDFHITVFEDRYPVTRGHLLFVPNYNTDAVIIDCMESAMLYGRRMVEQGHCEGFNIGINIGPAAGQTVMYPHVHLIPRRLGDAANPVGGVRGVIFGQADYKTTGYTQPT